MVQLSPSPTLEVIPLPEHATEGKQEDSVTGSSLKMGSPGGLNTPQFSTEVSTLYHGYETYIEDGLICLKHKVRNLEKKKVSLTGESAVMWAPALWPVCVPTAETARLREEAEARWGAKQRSNGESKRQWFRE